MSTFVYLITSHTQPTQVIRLIEIIRKLSPESYIAIHHDQSKSKLLEDDVTKIRNVYLIPNPIEIEWGGISQVDSFLHSVKWLATKISFDWLVLISGQDYPISNLSQFESDISASLFDGYFRYFPALGGGGNGWPKNTGEKRYYYKYFSFPHFLYYHHISILIQAAITEVLTLINKSLIFNVIIAAKKNKNKIGIKRFSTPFNDQFICYGGWDWFTLNKRCIEKILLTVTDNYSLLNYYKTTDIPSESFVHTILNNNFELNISNNPMRYVHWTGKNNSSPSIICSSDYEAVINSNMPFARKFDITVDAEVLDRIDNYLGLSD